MADTEAEPASPHGAADPAASGGATRPGYTISDLTMVRKELVIGFVGRGIPGRASVRPGSGSRCS